VGGRTTIRKDIQRKGGGKQPIPMCKVGKRSDKGGAPARGREKKVQAS